METEKTVAERLKDFMDHVGLSNSQFADTTGISRPTLSQLLNGRNKSINDQFLRKINEAYPQLDIRWLLFGSGDMLMDANSQFSGPQNAPGTDNPGADSSVNQEPDKSEGFRLHTSPELPKEISAIVSGASGAGLARKTDSPAQDSMAADAFYYDVRSMPESDSPEPRTDIKKEAASRKVTSILVLYSDGSFETFAPA